MLPFLKNADLSLFSINPINLVITCMLLKEEQKLKSEITDVLDLILIICLKLILTAILFLNFFSK